MLAMLLALVAGTGTPAGDQRLLNMTTLYEQVCLKAFPNDSAVESLMKAQEAQEFSPEQVKVTMRDDPARGWLLKGGEGTVWLEFPPYHACSVRWNAVQVGDLSVYRTIASTYEGTREGFTPIAPQEFDLGDIHVHAIGERRVVLGKYIESLLVIDQHITNQKRREAGETGVVFRFVHQFAPVEPTDVK